MDSIERRKQMEKEKKLMEWLAETKTKSNASNTIVKENKNKIFEIRKELIEYRKRKAKEKNIPPCYIFTNEELDKMLVLKPKTYSDLSGSMILPDIKLQLHGKEILNIFNKK